jgi:hypothetical protein
MITIPDKIRAKLTAKAVSLLDGYSGIGIDVWDAVMVNDLDGYDLNVYQENEDEPLNVTVYKVTNLNVDTSKWVHITDEVMNHG